MIIDTDKAKFQKLHPLPRIGNLLSSPADYKRDNSFIYRSPSQTELANFALNKLNTVWADVESAHALNIPLLEQNKIMYEAVKTLMVALGVPLSSYVADPKSRARNPKQYLTSAGWTKDLLTICNIDDTYSIQLNHYNSLLARYTTFATQAEQEDKREAQKAEVENEKARKARLEMLELTSIILRYGLDPQITWYEIFETLVKKDQLFDLGVAGMRTRGDWSEGFYQVDAALDRFHPRNSVEKEIYEDWSEIALSDDIDGRYFRDTKWDYNSVIALHPDKQLVQDLLTAYNKVT